MNKYEFIDKEGFVVIVYADTYQEAVIKARG